MTPPTVLPAMGVDSSCDGDAAMSALLDTWRQDGRQLVEDHWAEFGGFVQQVEGLIRRKRYRRAAAAAQVAANYAVLWHPGAFASPRLERSLSELGRAALPADGPRIPPPGPRLRVLHVATQVGSIGGHARMLWRWIAHDAGNIHTLALTRQTAAIPGPLQDAISGSGGRVHRVNRHAGGLLRWAEKLQLLTLEQDLVVLHVHNQDVIPFLAIAGMRQRPRVLLLNHADHVFWLGARSVDLVVNTRLSGHRLSADRRGIPPERNVMLPLCLEPVARRRDRGAAKRLLGLPEDSVVLLTVARSVKFRAIGGQSYADAFLPLLRRNHKLRLVAVGPGGAEDWSSAQAQAPGQIIAHGERPDTEAFFQAADIYVDSFPFISNTSMLEAGLHGLPVLTRYSFGPGCEIMGADSVGIDDQIIRATGLRDFEEKLRALIDDRELREDVGARTRAGLEAVNTGDGWSRALTALYATAFKLPLRTAGGSSGDAPRFEPTDLLMPFVFGHRLDQPSAAARRAPAVELGLKTMVPTQRIAACMAMAWRREFVFRPTAAAWRYLVPEWMTVRISQASMRPGGGTAVACKANGTLGRPGEPSARVSSAVAAAEAGAARRDTRGSANSPRSEAMHVVFCANPSYFQHAAVAAVSLAVSTRCQRIHVHLLTCDRDPASERMLRASLDAFPRVSLDIHRVAAVALSGVFVDRHLTKEAYLRFLIADLLPKDVGRALYLDCDLVVLSDILELFTADLDGMAVGGVEDPRWAGGATQSRLARLGARADGAYVNSGVLLLDLDQWRRDELSRKVFAFVEEHGSLLLRHDQDALNVVLQNRIRVLDARWNVQTLMFSPSARRKLLPEDAFTGRARRRPGIVHFSTGNKPWAFRAQGRRKHLYFRFLGMTAWRNSRPQLDTRAQRVEYDVARALLRVRMNVYAPLAFFRLIRGALALPHPARDDRAAVVAAHAAAGDR